MKQKYRRKSIQKKEKDMKVPLVVLFFCFFPPNLANSSKRFMTNTTIVIDNGKPIKAITKPNPLLQKPTQCGIDPKQQLFRLWQMLATIHLKTKKIDCPVELTIPKWPQSTTMKPSVKQFERKNNKRKQMGVNLDNILHRFQYRLRFKNRQKVPLVSIGSVTCCVDGQGQRKANCHKMKPDLAAFLRLIDNYYKGFLVAFVRRYREYFQCNYQTQSDYI